MIYLSAVAVAQEILRQTEEKLAGAKKIPERIVSFFDPDARAICKGKLAKPTEFGRTLEVNQEESGVIVDYQINLGNPSDKTELLPMMERFIETFGLVPDEVAADKGFYTAENVAALETLGVKHVGIAKLGRLTGQEKRHQHKKWFKRLFRFRAGIEACVSMLKRCFLLGRVLAKGSASTAIWTGWAILSYNLWQQT